MDRKTFTNVLSGVVIGGLLLTGGMALAGDEQQAAGPGANRKNTFFGQKMGHWGGKVKHGGQFGAGGTMLSTETLDQLVKDKVINESKAKEIEAYFEKISKEREDFLTKLKESTPEQRKALLEEKKEAGFGGRFRGGHDIFTGLIDEQILTQEQADTIQAKLHDISQNQRQQQIA